MSADTDAAGLLLDGEQVDARIWTAVTDARIVRSIEGTTRLTIDLSDPDRDLIRSDIFARRVTASIDKNLFELALVSKTGSALHLEFEDAAVADLRRRRGLVTAKAGTTTVDAFVRRLVTQAPGAQLAAHVGPRNLVPLARGSEDDPLEDSWSAINRLAEERNWRCFADRRIVYFGPDDWLLKRYKPLPVAEFADGIESLDWDADPRLPASEGSFIAALSRWQLAPGMSVTFVDQGLGSGTWLVREVERSLFSKQATVYITRRQAALPEPKPDPRDDGGSVAAYGSGPGGSVVVGPISAQGFSWPLSGTLTSGFGQRKGRLHAGLDIAVPIGTPVAAAKDGAVKVATYASGYGEVVYLDHADGTQTRYAHLSRLQVRAGQRVARGERLGLSGNTGNTTGPHLHFEVRVGGAAKDPLKYLPARR